MPSQFRSDSDLVSFVIGAKLPEWQRKLFERYAENIQVHSQGQIFYKLDRLFPNEHPESKHHRILSFESITEASFGRAANNVNRIFKNSSFSVEASEVVTQYTTQDSFGGVNFYSWFLDEWVKIAMKQDANARIVVYPPEYVKKYGRPPVVFVESKFIRHLADDAVVFVSEEESTIDYDIDEMKIYSERYYDQSLNKVNYRQAQENTYTPKLKETIKKYVYHAFFKYGFVRIEQVNEAGKEYEIEFFGINGFLPIIDAGGDKGKLDVNKSFLHPFVSFGNLALLQHSQHTAVNFTFSFPRMSEVHGPCDDCVLGKVACETDADIATYGDHKPCLKCGGSGFTANQTPYKVYIKTNDTSAPEGENKHLEVDDVKYYTPPTGILDYSKNEWRDYLTLAETSVYISQRVSTGNIESAKSKEIDRDDMFSFLSRVGQCYFSRMRFVLQCFENYMVSSPTQVSVAVPFSYAILSEGEAFAALKDILSSTVPVMLKASQVESFINKFVSQSSPIRKFLEVLKIVDPLLYYTNQEIQGFKSSNIVTLQQYSVHVFAFPTLQNMFMEDKTLSMQEVKAIANKLTEELKKYEPVEEKDLKTKLLEASQAAPQPQGRPRPQEEGNDDGGSDDGEISQDRLPLAIAQLSLALQRAEDSGNEALARVLREQMEKLLAKLAA